MDLEDFEEKEIETGDLILTVFPSVKISTTRVIGFFNRLEEGHEGFRYISYNRRPLRLCKPKTIDGVEQPLVKKHVKGVYVSKIHELYKGKEEIINYIDAVGWNAHSKWITSIPEGSQRLPSATCLTFIDTSS